MITLLSSLPARAEASDLFPQLKAPLVQELAGNWKVMLQDKEGKMLHTTYLTIQPKYKQYCEPLGKDICQYKARYSENKDWASVYWGTGRTKYDGGFQVSPGKIEFIHHYGIIGRWATKSSIRFKDGIGQGQWSYAQTGETGPETWVRMQPTVNRVDFYSVKAAKGTLPVSSAESGQVGRVTGIYEPGHYKWGPGNNAPGNRPRFYINIYGDNLWGFHIFGIQSGIGFDPDNCKYIKGSTKASNHGVIGMRCPTLVWHGVSNGMKTLTLDNIRIPFFFDIKGLPEDSAKLTLGNIDINYTHPEIMKSHEKQEIDGEIAAINRRLESLDDKIEAINTKGKQLGAAEQKRLKPFEDELDALLNPIPKADHQSVDYTNREFRIKTRLTEGSRMLHAYENVQAQFESTSEDAVRVKQDLQKRAGEIRLELLENQAELDKELAAKQTEDIRLGIKIDQDAYYKAMEEFNNTKQDSQRKLRIVANELLSHEATRREYQAQIEQLKIKAAEQAMDLKAIASRGAILPQRIESPHAKVRFDFNFQELSDINQSVKQAARALKTVTDRRERARDELIEAVTHADASANSKAFAGYASALGQASIDALMQIEEVAEAGAKGGPAAALAEAISHIGSNLSDIALSGGPKIYEADPSREWYDSWGAQTSREKSDALKKKTEALLSQKQKEHNAQKETTNKILGTVNTASKTVQSYIKTGVQTQYKRIRQQELLDNLPPVDGVIPKNLSDYLDKQFSAQMKAVREADINWDKMSGQNGARSFIVDFTKKATINIAKGAVVDQVKRTIAQMLESGPIRDYMDAQREVSRTVAMFRHLGAIYWDQKEVYESLLKRRDDLLAGLDIRQKNHIVLEENLPFAATPDYTFRIYYMGKEARHQVDADLWVAGKKLPRGKHPNSYVLGEKVAVFLKESDLSMITLNLKIH